MKNKNKPLVPASKLKNENNLYLFFSTPEVLEWVSKVRHSFRIPLGGFELLKKAEMKSANIQKIVEWTLWMREKEGKITRLKALENKINTFLQSYGPPEICRDDVCAYIQYGIVHGLARRNVRLVHRRDRPNSIFVEFVGPISKQEMLALWSEINSMMETITHDKWHNVFQSRENLKQSFIDREAYRKLQPFYRRYRSVVNEDKNMTEKDILRQAATIKKAIQRLNKKTKNKK